MFFSRFRFKFQVLHGGGVACCESMPNLIERPSPIDFCVPRDRGGDGTVLGDLLENCVTEVLLRLDPLEICQMARLSRMFRGATSGDGVWESKLLTNYARLLAVAEAGDGEAGQATGSAPEAEPLPKKELYARLCRRNRFDGGKKEFWLDKGGGGLCMSISSRALSITGIDDRRYWNFIPSDESRFRTVAYLSQIWWFEVRGEVEFFFPKSTYNLFYRIHLGRPFKRNQRSSGRDHQVAHRCPWANTHSQ
ncbi:F-box protein PP2-A13 [Zea mays]|uniref:F-box protein PP2-A13 n=1 Tax=Zea mays TaxID=4577 RepID=A0A1D6IYE5_MAIZE|nr:F-box protein PP2-A13 [Zea mays]